MKPFLSSAIVTAMLLNVPVAGAWEMFASKPKPKLVDPQPMQFRDFGMTAAIPGSGFDYKKMAFTGYDCLTGKEGDPIGRPESNIDFSMGLTSEDVKKELGVSADFRTKMGAGELSGGAKFAKATAESSTSITMNYVVTNHFTNRYYIQSGVNDYVMKNKRIPSLLEKGCGQGFVKEIVRGAKLFFSIRFDFGSRDDKEAFGAELHYNSPMTSFNAEVKNKAEKLSKHARVTVSAYQLGGQVEKLAFIFKNTPKEKIKVDETGKTGPVAAHYAAIECAMGAGLDECKQALEDALAYATDETNPNSFPNQLDTRDEQGKEPKSDKSPVINNMIATLAYNIVPYAYPELVQIPGLNEAVQEQKDKLLALLSKNVDNLNALDGLRHGVIRYTDKQQAVFAGGEAILRKQQEPMIKTALYCYQQDEIGCGVKVDELTRLLDGLDKDGKPLADRKGVPLPNPYKFDEDILNPMPETFAQFCAATHSIKPKYVDLNQRESVLAIEEIVTRPGSKLVNQLTQSGYFAEETDSIRKCAMLEDVLMAQNDLDLSYRKEAYKISDLNVIANLTQLQKLTMRYQNVREISALRGFRDLKVLDLEGNRVEDVSVLAQNDRLETLRLAANQIRSVAELKRLPSLSLLDVRKNLPTVECFEAPSLKQCMLARSKWLVQFTNTSNTVDLGLMFGQVSEFAGGYVVSGARHGHRSNYVAVLDKSAQTAEGFSVRTGNLQFAHVWSADTKIDDTHVLVTGGWPNYSMNSLEVYDAAGGFRSAVGQMTDMRAGHTATLLDGGLVLVAGGYSSHWSIGTDSAQSTAELIDPKAPGGPKVVQRLEMNAPRAWHTATKLKDGRVLMIGGFAGSRGVRAMEVFDPNAKRFVPLGNLKQARGGHTITELPDGKYLIVGGFKDNATAVESAEILDPQTLTTRYTKGSLNFARGMHMAQRLPNGEIVFAGGMKQPFKDEDEKSDPDGLNLIEMKDTSFDFKEFADRDERGQKTEKKHPGVCQVCLDSTEVYLPQEESFVPNPESLNSRRAGSAVVPVNTTRGLFSFRIWGGLDSATSSTLESGTVTEDPLN